MISNFLFMRVLISALFLFLPVWLFAANPVVHNTARGIELRNNHVAIVLSANGEMASCVEIQTGTDIAAHDKRKIARAILKSGKSVETNKIALNGDQLSVFFGSEKIVMNVKSFSDYFTVEVKDVPKDFESLSFIDLKMKYNYAATNPFVAVGVAMTLQTNPVYYPSGESKAALGECYAHTGMNGAKLAIVACRKDELRSVLKEVYRTVPKGALPIDSTGGGPFALDDEANRYDCVMIRDADPSKVQDWLRFYTPLGIRQYSFLQGSDNFVNGQFSFPKTGSAAAFKQQITDPLFKEGIISTLHTYSYYISYSAKELLSNPKWQQQLEFREVFTLSQALSTVSTDIAVSGDKSCLKNDDAFYSVHTPYILIDNEIIKYSIGEGGFVSCKRGQCGTIASTHRTGAKVRIIGGFFKHIAPQMGSELFYEVARRTAKAYNEGGFRGFYFDAIDGLEVHLKHAGLSDFRWYYGAAFVNEVLKYCEKEPLVVEYSDISCTTWSGRGRGGAWDTPSRAYKRFIDDHLSSNKIWMDRLYVTTLGWYNFYPTKKSQPGDYSTKYMMLDDVDYLGTKSIAYDQTMVYNGLSEKDVQANPGLKRNLERYAQYNRLRQEGYFSEKVKATLRESRHEFSLDQQNGVWGFVETEYSRAKLRDIGVDRLSGNNPFKRQEPFIRLENLYSSDGSSGINLMWFNESVDLKEQSSEKTFNTPLDLSNHLGIKVTVKGNGMESKDAICIRLRSLGSNGYADFVVLLNFQGWREVILPNLDNAENKGLSFKGMDNNQYNVYRRDVDYTQVKYVQVFKSEGCKDARLKSIDAVPLSSNSLTEPSVHVGSANVTFMDVINSGEYVEYKAGERSAHVYDSMGNSRNIMVKRKGRFRVPNGHFTATVSGKPELNGAPSEVTLTVGVYGNYFKNN